MIFTVPEYGFPDRYDENCLFLMVRDPHCIFAFWELSVEQVDVVASQFGRPWGEIPLTIRVYDLTGLDRERDQAHSWYDFNIHSLANNYYIKGIKANHAYSADLGVKTPDGRFVILIRSNTVQTPRDSLADGSGAVMVDLLDRQEEAIMQSEVETETFSSEGVYINNNREEGE